jgi:hypothetical protein
MSRSRITPPPALALKKGDQAGVELYVDQEHSMKGNKSESRESGWPAGIGAPARRALEAAGYNRLEQLAGVREAELMKLHGMGPKAMSVLRDALAARGLSMAAE